MKRIKKLLSALLAITICVTLFPCNIAHAAETDGVSITVNDGTTNYPVTLSSYTVSGIPAGVYEATLPKDYTSATVTWSGCYVYCGCNEYEGEYKDGTGSLTVKPHKCKAPKAFGDFPEDAVMLYLADTDYDDWACLILYAGEKAGESGNPDIPKQEYDLTYTLEKNGDHSDRYITACKVKFTDSDGNAITKATEGQQVTATASDASTASKDYQLEVWSTDADITVPTDSSKSFTFTMPASAVNLKVKFKAVGATVTWESIADNSATPPELIINDCYYGDDCASTRTVITRIGGQLFLTFSSDYYEHKNEWKFLGWTVTADGQDITDQIWQNTGVEWGTIQSVPNVSEIHVVGKFHRLSYAGVGVEVNDSTMGTATAVVGTGTPATNLPVVFEDQVVTLTATPGERYTLDHWEVKDADGTAFTVAPDTQDANKATFTMPGTGKAITAKAFFKLDPDKASTENLLNAVSLYTADGSTLIKAADKSGTAFTITLPEEQDTTNLASFVLKFDISDYASIKVKGAEENWPTGGKACNMTLDTPVTFVVTAENGAPQEYTVEIKQERTLSSEKAITAVKLLNGSTTIATGTLSGNVWTIDLPSDTEQALLNKIGASTEIKMQIDYTGASVKQEEGYDDASGSAGKWSSGNVMCAISPNSQASFTVTAEDSSTANYVIKITYTAPASSKPTLSNGAATRTSDTAATVTFTSSAAGSYYYTVVNAGAAEPEIETTGSGTSASAGTNTISLTNLTAGARDIYIAVKSASGEVSDNLKIVIPAFGEEPGGDTPTEPDTGDFTITVSCPTGGTITTSRTKANRGDEITVTATPDSGYQLVAGSLKFTLGVAGGESTVITNGKFTMPSCDVTVSCKWEKVQTVVSGITAFSIDGVQGVVDNSTNTISVVMPYGTDVTQLIPTISGNHIASISPVSGKMVNFSQPVIYTVTLTDGTTKQYTVTVYVQKGTQADQMWDKLTDFYNQTPWWEYADNQISTGHYPKYW